MYIITIKANLLPNEKIYVNRNACENIQNIPIVMLKLKESLAHIPGLFNFYYEIEEQTNYKDTLVYIKNRQKHIQILKTLPLQNILSQFISLLYTKRHKGWVLLGCLEKYFIGSTYHNNTLCDLYEYYLCGKKIYSNIN